MHLLSNALIVTSSKYYHERTKIKHEKPSNYERLNWSSFDSRIRDSDTKLLLIYSNIDICILATLAQHLPSISSPEYRLVIENDLDLLHNFRSK